MQQLGIKVIKDTSKHKITLNITSRRFGIKAEEDGIGFWFYLNRKEAKEFRDELDEWLGED